jgi:hypothetical protein
MTNVPDNQIEMPGAARSSGGKPQTGQTIPLEDRDADISGKSWQIMELVMEIKTEALRTEIPGQADDPQLSGLADKQHWRPKQGEPRTAKQTVTEDRSTRAQRQKARANRKETLSDTIVNPDTGKATRSFLNYQNQPVFLKHPCTICESNGQKNKIHFSFECPGATANVHKG